MKGDDEQLLSKEQPLQSITFPKNAHTYICTSPTSENIVMVTKWNCDNILALILGALPSAVAGGRDDVRGRHTISRSPWVFSQQSISLWNKNIDCEVGQHECKLPPDSVTYWCSGAFRSFRARTSVFPNYFSRCKVHWTLAERSIFKYGR